MHGITMTAHSSACFRNLLNTVSTWLPVVRDFSRNRCFSAVHPPQPLPMLPGREGLQPRFPH